jgi:hypothetical protein
MSLSISSQTEQVAGGRRAASSEPRRARAGLPLRLCSSPRSHPLPAICATRTTGAPPKDLLFTPLSAPLSARSPKSTKVVENPVSEPPGNSRRSL